MDNVKELLLLMHNAKGIYRVTPNTEFVTAQMLAMAMSDLYVTVTMIDGCLEYRLTDKGVDVAEQYAREQETALNESAGGFSDSFPAFYRHRTNGCVVLAVNPTCGTVIRQANVEIEGEYSLPVGTFQTCFISFFVSEEWELLDTKHFRVTLLKG